MRYRPPVHPAIAAAGLAGRPVTVLDAPGAGTALVVDVEPDEQLAVWARARAAVAETGRWPLLCTRDLDDVFDRFYFEEGAQGADDDPAAIIARAAGIDVDARLAALRPPDGGDWPEREPDPYFQELYGTESGLALVLLPTPDPWAAYAYVHALDSASGYGHDLLVAAAKRWHERYGAEPVAALAVMSWLTVTRPPTDDDELLRLAVEHEILAENTLSTPGLSRRQHARMLSGADRWVLFSRP